MAIKTRLYQVWLFSQEEVYIVGPSTFVVASAQNNTPNRRRQFMVSCQQVSTKLITAYVKSNLFTHVRKYVLIKRKFFHVNVAFNAVEQRMSRPVPSLFLLMRSFTGEVVKVM
jgi:hypothetical protein